MESRLLPGESVGALFLSPVSLFADTEFATEQPARRKTAEVVAASGRIAAADSVPSSGQGHPTAPSPRAADAVFTWALTGTLGGLPEPLVDAAYGLDVPRDQSGSPGAAAGACPGKVILINGGFESPAIGSPWQTFFAPSEAIPGWFVFSGSTDLVTEAFARPAFEGRQYLDLDGASPGGLFQVFVTTAGANYRFSFAYANNPYPQGGATVPAFGLIILFDDQGLLDIGVLVHDSSTPTALDWTGFVSAFRAREGVTFVLFLSLNPEPSSGGIFLDGVCAQRMA